MTDIEDNKNDTVVAAEETPKCYTTHDIYNSDGWCKASDDSCWSWYNYRVKCCINGFYSAYTTNGICSAFCLNAVLSLMSLNCIFCFLSINSLFSILSTNCVMSILSTGSTFSIQSNKSSFSMFSTDSNFAYGCEGEDYKICT